MIFTCRECHYVHTRANTCVCMHMLVAVSGVRCIHGKMLFPLLGGGGDTGGCGQGGPVPSAGKSVVFSHEDF